MSTFRILAIVAAVLCVWAAGTRTADAQSFAERVYIPPEEQIASPQEVTWDLIRAGIYEAPAAEFEGFGGDKGPIVGTELVVHVYRIPYVGPIGLGARVGWAQYDGRALTEGENAGESTELTIFPMAPLASLRVETLARELDFPVVLTGKLGFHIIPWRVDTGGSTEARGGSLGLLWAAQAALELDFLEPRAARRLDEDWGINHSYLFFELFGSTAGSQGGELNLGADLAWVAGLGFVI